MEGRLSKIWMVGLRYDGCQIKIGEQKLDFTISGADYSEIPAHVLYILRNGGGKGVFLQSIFQPLDPLCSWKNDENKVTHFFHNSAGKPVQYTFHVVEEWYISPTKKMMIGISVCPKISSRERNFDKDPTIELDYILFSKIYSPTNEFDIFKLPLWDEAAQESMPLDEWKSTLNNSSDIQSYTMHKKTDYIQLLEENGLDQHTISMMKSINLSEGSISSYFKGSTDNMGIFHNKIIPTINNKIEEIVHLDTDTVSIITTSFLETLKVAKELPLLLSIIRSIEELNEFTSPLADMYQEADVLLKVVQYFQQKGQEISHLFHKIHLIKTELKSSTKTELNELSKKIEKLDWQRENLRYVDECNQLALLDLQYQKFALDMDVQNSELANINYNSNIANVNVLIKKYHLLLSKIEQTKMSLSLLERECDISEIQQQLDEIKKYFVSAWNLIYQNWQQKLTTHHRLQLSYTNKFKAYNTQITDEDALNRNIEYSITRINENIDKHKLKQELIVSEFGEKIRLFPDEVINTYQHEFKSKTNTLSITEETMNTKCSDIEKFNNDLCILKINLEGYEKTIQILTKDSKAQVLKEDTIRVAASSLLKENLEELYIRADYQSLKQKIAFLHENTEQQLKQYTYSLIELEIEMNLINEGKAENVYIPNKDLVRLKKLLDDNQISNMYGTQFLKQCSRDDRMFHLRRNPSLPFSIIVLQEGFENIDLSFLRDELFRSMVILVDGLKMNKLNEYDTVNPSVQKISEISFIPNDLTFLLTTDDYELHTRIVNSEKKLDDFIFTIDEKTKILSKINTLQNNIDILLCNKLSREIEKELITTNQTLQDTHIQKLSLESNLRETRQYISTLKESLKKLQSEILENKSKLDHLYQWNQECATFLQNNVDLKDLNKKFDQSKKILVQLNNQLESLKVQHSNNEQTFVAWLNSIRQDFSTLKILLGDISFPQPIIDNEFSEDRYLNLYSYGYSLESENYNHLRAYKDLMDKKSNQNSRIAKCQLDLENQTDAIVELEDTLLNLGSHDYQNTEPPTEDLIILEKIANDLETKVKSLSDNIVTLNTEIEQNSKSRSELKKRINDTKDDLEGRYPEYGAVTLNVDDINLQKEKIKSYRHEAKSKENILRKTLDNLSQEISRINTLLSNFDFLHIEASDKISILNDDEKISLHEMPNDFYDNWFYQLEGEKKKLDIKNRELTNHMNRVKDFIDSSKHLPLNYRNNLLDFLNQIKNMDYTQAILCIDSYNSWAQHNLQEEHGQTKKADDAVNFWVERAARRVLEICQSIDDLEKKMKIKNWNGILFPLIQMDKSYSYPKKVEDIRFEIKQFCLNMIKEIMKKNPNIDELTLKQLSKYINMSNIVLHVLGEYPKLKIYIPSIEGPLLRGEPHNSYYKEWETINHGSSTSSTKSGGQTLMAQFIVMAMIMRQSADEHSWLFLVSDNPFGTMSAPELVEAVFSLLELLKIQWLVVAPPITNVDITSKFNTVFQMNVESVDGETKLTKKVIKNSRKFLEPISILNPDKGKM